ncbi:hypothetical protein [Cryptosporangium aurantiacum]|uniref:Uncharacterized protein n=1 Tax=Cryptosporangium aurantiacum TaxID=134849 RepID=A0A1M7KYM7_9ACTN|nr:hypothetical protein [Cryptosporangium aurantiacum]SHM70686.1 hypothetical protein SAMN05443668_1011300 [Cryptosporangium aurantiacum]
MDTPDQHILYALRQEISEHQLSMNAAGLDLGVGVALIDTSRAQWQEDPDQIVSFTAVQLAQAIAAAKHQGMEEAFQLAQNVIAPPAADAQPRAYS